jgi:hypothetical protein
MLTAYQTIFTTLPYELMLIAVFFRLIYNHNIIIYFICYFKDTYNLLIALSVQYTLYKFYNNTKCYVTAYHIYLKIHIF